MPVYKSRASTKDGRCWFYKTQYFLPGDEEQKINVSKKYATKAEAIMAEQEFILSLVNKKDIPVDMTFKELIDLFLDYKKDKVRFTTYRGYEQMLNHLKDFYNVKCVKYNIHQYEAWKKRINSETPLCTRTKNDLLKFWKSILNYGMTWYNFDFITTYRRMTNFTNPNERKKEMSFYTYEEFNRFLSVEKDLKYRCFFETLYFCGLRCGESRGLQWKDIDFDKKILSITKQVIRVPLQDNGKRYAMVNPKTRTSNRRIPICDVLLEDLKKYKSILIKKDLFDDEYFVFGETTTPFQPEIMRDRKKMNAELANVKCIRLHDFRHSCASLLINSGGNITMVAKYLGHSEIEETLNTYSHLFPSALDNVLNIINKLD